MLIWIIKDANDNNNNSDDGGDVDVEDDGDGDDNKVIIDNIYGDNDNDRIDNDD